MMASEPGTSTKRADLEWRGVGWLLVLLHDLPDLLDREAEEGLRETVATFGLVAPDGSLTARGEEARRAALRLLAERQVSPARIEALAGGDVARWAALADAATPGPWWFDDKAGEVSGVPDEWGDGTDLVCEPNDESAAFIAAARTAVPALCAEVARLRAALEDVKRSLVREVAAVGIEAHRQVQADVPPANAEERETSGYAAALVTLAAWTCITGRPDDAARAFAGLLGTAGESEDGRRGAARALMHVALALLWQPVPATTAEQDVDALRREAKKESGIDDRAGRVYAAGIRRALDALAPHLPSPRGAR